MAARPSAAIRAFCGGDYTPASRMSRLYERLNPGELQIELFCRGLRIDPSCEVDDGSGDASDGRPIKRTRAGLGSGLELVIPGEPRDVWLNVPVVEGFVDDSPWLLRRRDGVYEAVHEPSGAVHRVRIPHEPTWYAQRTSSGKRMSDVGVLQGTYLGIYIGPACQYWRGSEPTNCRFCTTGRNIGVNEALQKSIDDVVETALAAKAESGVTFVHLNSGFQQGTGVDLAAPYVKALKERVGCLVGVQLIPVQKDEHWKYDWLHALGADHFSFCYEFHNPEYFAGLLPGKEATVGRDTFFDALEYCSALLGKGACSGEIIAGVEPVADTIRAIDYITGVGAFPTVCILRPVIDADMEDYPSPDPLEMQRVMSHMWTACRSARIPIGAAPNIEVSLIVQPTDTVYHAPGGFKDWLYKAYLAFVKRAASGLMQRRMAKQPIALPAVAPAQPDPQWGKARYTPSPLRAAVSPPGTFAASDAAKYANPATPNSLAAAPA